VVLCTYTITSAQHLLVLRSTSAHQQLHICASVLPCALYASPLMHLYLCTSSAPAPTPEPLHLNLCTPLHLHNHTTAAHLHLHLHLRTYSAPQHLSSSAPQHLLLCTCAPVHLCTSSSGRRTSTTN
jgi:hypothetical protein